MKYINILGSLYLLSVCLLSCGNGSVSSKGDKDVTSDNIEIQNLDSVRKQKRLMVNDSIDQMADTLFAGFRLGMSEKEYNTVAQKFKKDVGNKLEICNLDFWLDTPEFENNKLVGLNLIHTDFYYSTDDASLIVDYYDDLKERYYTRLGTPDLFLNEDFSPCNPSSEKLRNIAWVFNNRVILLSKESGLDYDKRIQKSYIISFVSREMWDNLNALIEEANKTQKEHSMSVEKKRGEYSDAI